MTERHMILITWALGAWLTVSADNVIVHDLYIDNEGIYSCPDGSPPLTLFSGNEHIGWITSFGCGWPPPSNWTPGGCKVGNMYTKPIVTLDKLSADRWKATISCKGEPAQVPVS